MRQRMLFTAIIAFAAAGAGAAGNDWDRLVEGGRFMDRLLPMQGHDMRSDVWGAASVRPRLADNGIESPDTSFWGGNILLGEDGLYHINVAGWPESSPKGHNTWSQSDTYHAVGSNVWGPFRVTATLGKGHNPETYRAKDGRYVCYVIDGRYVSDNIAGPWEYGKFDFDTRDRDILSGLSNITFARRQDGSMLAVCRGGSVWVSRDGISAYRQIADHSVYSGNKRYFEDPVIWRDSLQYHLIVNDWNARIAYYSRSLDGLHWVTEQGEAYLPGCSVHEDGTVENWYKYERAKIFQDASGRAAQINFAVIDTIKNEDKANDSHSSKNITIPLNRGLLLEVLNTEPVTEQTPEIRLLIKAEDGFSPRTDVDVESLVFGSFSEVNYGRGCRAVSSEARADGLVVTFSGKGSGIDETEFAPKLIGKDTDGKMIYGYARLPYVNYRPAILSAMRPDADGVRMKTVEIENFGLSASSSVTVRVTDNSGRLLAAGHAGPLEPYGCATVSLDAEADIPAGASGFKVAFYGDDGKKIDENSFGIKDIQEKRGELRHLVDSAEVLCSDPRNTNGRAELEAAADRAEEVTGSFSLRQIADEVEAMKKALNAFNFANASADNPKPVGLENPDMAALDGWDILHDTGSPCFSLNTRHSYENFTSPFMETWITQSELLGMENYARQTVSDCQEGHYRLTAAVLATRQGSGVTVSGVSLFVNDDSIPCSTADKKPCVFAMDYTLASPGPLTVGLHVDASTNANWVAWDNMRLEYLGRETVSGIYSRPVSRQCDAPVYSLAGQLVDTGGDALGTLPRGVYIISGNKYVVR